MQAHQITMLGTGLIGDFYTATLHGQRGRDHVQVVFSRSEERAATFAERWSIPFDLGQAAAYMQLAAWDRGIGSCIGAIYDESKARAILQIPADLDFKLALSFGYPQADVTEGPPRRGGRKALDELTHWDHW